MFLVFLKGPMFLRCVIFWSSRPSCLLFIRRLSETNRLKIDGFVYFICNRESLRVNHWHKMLYWFPNLIYSLFLVVTQCTCITRRVVWP